MGTLDAYKVCPCLDLQDSQVLRKEINIQPVSVAVVWGKQ